MSKSSVFLRCGALILVSLVLNCRTMQMKLGKGSIRGSSKGSASPARSTSSTLDNGQVDACNQAIQTLERMSPETCAIWSKEACQAQGTLLRDKCACQAPASPNRGNEPGQVTVIPDCANRMYNTEKGITKTLSRGMRKSSSGKFTWRGVAKAALTKAKTARQATGRFLERSRTGGSQGSWRSSVPTKTRRSNSRD